MIIVNESSEEPTTTYTKGKCTRACHNNLCKHFIELNDDNIVKKNFNIYKKNINWLKNNPFGLSYASMNILVYVILFPLFSSILIWRILKK